MTARHIINPSDNTRRLDAEPCRAIDPVWQQLLDGSERLECAACGRPVEPVPEPMTLDLEELTA